MVLTRDQNIGAESGEPELKDIFAVDLGLEDIREALRELWIPKLVVVSQEKIVVSSGAYEAGDVVSESVSAGTAWRFVGMAKKAGGGGYITKGLVMAETTAIASRLSLFLFTDTPTCALNDDVQNTAPLKADRNIYVGRIDFPACDDVGAGMSESMVTPSTVGRLPVAFVCKHDSLDLYGVLAIHGTEDLADFTTLTIVLTVEQF